MCGAMRPKRAKIEGCLSLLQLWARFRFLFLCPRLNHPYTFPLITRWNHPACYARLPSTLKDIQLLLDQRSEAELEWTPYEDPPIRAVIPEEFLQNPNAWHVKVVLINYATVEPHQSDRVLRQFGCRQPISMDHEEFDEQHKIDLRQLNTNWPRYWSGYIDMWGDRQEYIPTWEAIIVPELACVPEYMPWFRIHGKPYLLTPEQRQRQIRVERERREPLNPRRQDDEGSPSTRPRCSPGASSTAM
ncbi:serine/threonine-protein phosphatase 7 long form homolog [Gossypium raimondii]|uniref:serine/threonine-protein phosphatase 7 long form homolog n=1 Tax=Gossypium raimondii TaxID=29730 RepID=UPI00227A1546|nr:serine/threonine-protein phosphatase 7 long form homolog [Gossypium raimondii]